MAKDDESDVVYVERLPARGFALLSAGLGGGLAIVGGAYGVLGAMGDTAAFIAAAVFGVAGLATSGFGLLHAVQRNYVTLDSLKVELGLGEVVIPLDVIQSVELVEDTAELRRRLYAEHAKKVALVSSKKLVRVEWLEDGAPRVFYAGSRYPEQLRDAIRAAAAHRRRNPSLVRVAEQNEEPAEVAVPAKARAQREKKR